MQLVAANSFHTFSSTGDGDIVFDALNTYDVPLVTGEILLQVSLMEILLCLHTAPLTKLFVYPETISIDLQTLLNSEDTFVRLPTSTKGQYTVHKQ